MYIFFKYNIGILNKLQNVDLPLGRTKRVTSTNVTQANIFPAKGNIKVVKTPPKKMYPQNPQYIQPTVLLQCTYYKAHSSKEDQSKHNGHRFNLIIIMV